MAILHIRNLSYSKYRQLYSKHFIISWPIYFRILGYYRVKILRMSRNMNMHQKLAVHSKRVIRILSCLKYGNVSAQYMVATPEQKAKVGKYTAKNATNVNFLIKLFSKKSEFISLILQYLQTCFLNNIFNFSKVNVFTCQLLYS